MRSFILKTIVYLSPVMLLTGALAYILHLDKETVPLKTIIESQLNGKTEQYYFRSFFDNSVFAYKMKMAKRKNAGILVVGQSTVLEFNKEMFVPYQDSFYNLGFAIHNVNGVGWLVDMIENHQIHKPDLMIIGVDAGLIKKYNAPDDYPDESILNFDPVEHVKYHLAADQMLLKQMLFSRSFNVITNKDLGYGLLGTQGQGFRRDGSLHYANIISNYMKHPVFTDGTGYKAMLDNKDYIFTEPYEVDTAKVNKLTNCFNRLKNIGVQVVVFFPPISDDFHDYFSANSGFNRFFNSYLELQNAFEAKHFDVISFTTPKQFGLSDNYMLDGIHPGEVFVAKLWYKFLLSHSLGGRTKCIDKGHLNNLIQSDNNMPLSFMQDTLVFAPKHKQ